MIDWIYCVFFYCSVLKKSRKVATLKAALLTSKFTTKFACKAEMTTPTSTPMKFELFYQMSSPLPTSTMRMFQKDLSEDPSEEQIMLHFAKAKFGANLESEITAWVRVFYLVNYHIQYRKTRKVKGRICQKKSAF